MLQYLTPFGNISVPATPIIATPSAFGLILCVRTQHRVLLDIAAAVGLSRQHAEAVLEQRSFKNVVDADWEKSSHYGVTGVPTFVTGRRGIVGAQPYEVIEKLLTEAGVPKR